ncbi:hypothetical protein LTR36_004293 [Oleoguttula mirabilis]|uniref:Uncharacterized protein n=1 Tax=Oleoguttula mirabilis TaxID=1507867 RepID=A0AAV9JH38_9PEZI|nr:hypothetical protein LTR36_004293 [Oleoguttula mirabilis]
MPDRAPLHHELLAYSEAIVPFAAERPFYQMLRQAPYSGTHDAGAALLLIVATQVEKLAIEIHDAVGAEANVPCVPGYKDSISLVSRLIYLSVTACELDDPFSRTLGRVKRAELSLPFKIGFPHICPAEAIAPFIRLPRSEFAGSRIGKLSAGQTWCHGSKTVNITHLRLQYCNLDTASTVAIIASCTALEILVIVWQTNLGGGNGLYSDAEVLQLDFAEVGDALRQHSGSLVHLTLDTFSGDCVSIAETPPLGSLISSFTKLRTLDINDRWVYGDRLDSIWEDNADIGDLGATLRDSLPSGHEVFTFRMRKQFTLYSDNLKAVASCSCPAMRQFTLTVPLLDGWATDAQLEELSSSILDHCRNIAEQSGV